MPRWRPPPPSGSAATRCGCWLSPGQTEETETDGETKDKTIWRYSVVPDYVRDTLLAMAKIDPAECWRMPFTKTKAKARPRPAIRAKCAAAGASSGKPSPEM
jgi:hypothetical protein